jgi:hypothetical protein
MPTTHIELLFTHSGKKVPLYTGTFSYRSKVSLSDTLNITNKCILIETKRSSLNTKPLQSHNSTFYKQIIKSLCLYYLLEKHPNQLRKINLTKRSSGKIKSKEEISKIDIRQVVKKSANLAVLKDINNLKAQIVLQETETGKAVLNAATHLIKSIDSSSAYDRFEKLWRAFNALYRAFAKQNTDHDCHVALRAHLLANPNLFPLSLSKVASLTAQDIRKNIRLNAMILNNHSTQVKTKGFADSVKRNTDRRILEIYDLSLPIREKFLKTAHLYTDLVAYIAAGIAKNSTCDAEVVSLLCIKYMYFVRNKIAHAEKTDHGFTFTKASADEAEISWLAPFLEALVVDMINISDTF